MSEISKTTRTLEVLPDGVELDWVTATAKPGPASKALAAYGRRIASLESEAGDRLFDWRWSGYEGQATRFMRWGEREDGAIIMLMSYAAPAYWRALAKMVVRASRLDLKCDFWTSDEDAGDLVRWCYDAMRSTGVSKANLTYYENSKGGQTLYCGSRKSDSMLRFYDRSARVNGEIATSRCFRVELELKRKQARNIWFQLVVANSPRPIILAHIRTKVLRVGLPLIFPETTIQMNVTQSEARVYDDDRSLLWLQTSVAPSIRRLVNAGRLEDVERALGVKLFYV